LLKKVFIASTLVIIGLFTSLLFYPNISKLKYENPQKTSFMKYREKEWLKEGKKYKIQQKWIKLSKVSPYLIKAVLISEDDKFWKHEGFDYDAIKKAIEKDIKAKKFKVGGSTISQQVTKNLYLSPSKNPIRKLIEFILTWRLERTLTKKRILEIYLNIAEWGDKGIFGIEMAAQHYYGKHAYDLNPEESARLAAVLPNPRIYNPLSNSKYVINRSNLIYSIMLKRGIIAPEYDNIITNEEQSEESNIEQLDNIPETPNDSESIKEQPQ
jgi:monofunctional biosynthetic peptidoglycan transglycosylase